MSKVQEALCDLIQADGYGVIEAITEANAIIAELKDEKPGTIYNLHKDRGDRLAIKNTKTVNNDV